jgi:DNA repair photolyase
MIQQATLPLAPALPNPVWPWAPNDSGSLLRRLRQAADARQPVLLGATVDPYSTPERYREALRPILDALGRLEGLTVSIDTRSPRVREDADRLAELDSQHAIRVRMALPAVDPDLAALLDPKGAPPEERLEAVERLAAAGLSVVVAIKPMMPWINHEERTLRPLVAAAAEAGAADVEVEPLVLRRETRPRLLPWLHREFPELVGVYKTLYGRNDRLAAGDRERLLVPFRALRLEYGFPRMAFGRG